MGKHKKHRGKSSESPVVADPAPGTTGAARPVARPFLVPVLAAVGLLILYVATLAPSIMGGDSGELTSSALTGGVPHPPGYPLFAILARFFAALPLGHSPAWRVSLLSAVCTAAAGGLLCALVQAWSRSSVAGLLAAALFGTNTVVWLHALSAEVFGLNVMFVALAFLLWLQIERTSSRRFVFGLAFSCGLAMCNHHTFVFVGMPLLLRSFWVARRELGAKGMVFSVALGMLGLAPYAYLFAASTSKAAVSWGDLSTLDGFAAHVLRRAYGTFSMGQASKTGGAFVDEGTFFPTLWRMTGHAFPRFVWLGPLLSVAGFYLGIKDRQQRKPVAVLGGIFCFYVLTFCTLSNLAPSNSLFRSVIVRFCIQADFMMAVAAGLGFAQLWTWLSARFARLAQWPRLAFGFPVVVFMAGVALHGHECNQRDNHIFSDFVSTAFASLPPNAIVITMGDHLTGSVFYFREVEKLRSDVIHLDRELLGYRWYCSRKRSLYPDLFLPEGGYGKNGWNIKKLLDGNPRRPVVVIDRLDNWDQSWKDGYKLATNGLVHPLLPADKFPSFEEWQSRDRKAMGNYDIRPSLLARYGTWERVLGELVLTTQGGRGHLILVYSHERNNDRNLARQAVNLLEDIVGKAGGDPELAIPGQAGMPKLLIGPNIWKDLGIGYEILSQGDASYAPRIGLAFEKFVERAVPDDADLPAARGYLEKHPPRRGSKP
jgi:hypothetical protein